MSPAQPKCVHLEETIQWCAMEACETRFLIGQEAKKVNKMSFQMQRRRKSEFTILGSFMIVVIKDSWISCT